MLELAHLKVGIHWNNQAIMERNSNAELEIGWNCLMDLNLKLSCKYL